MPDLVWDESLAASSAAWAKGCRFSHSRTGENLCAGHKDWNACISAWYNEIASYNYKQGSFSSAVRVSTFFFALFFSPSPSCSLDPPFSFATLSFSLSSHKHLSPPSPQKTRPPKNDKKMLDGPRYADALEGLGPPRVPRPVLPQPLWGFQHLRVPLPRARKRDGAVPAERVPAGERGLENFQKSDFGRELRGELRRENSFLSCLKPVTEESRLFEMTRMRRLFRAFHLVYRG